MNASQISDTTGPLGNAGAAERYIQQVMGKIHASTYQRGRIEADLRAHLNDALQAGQPVRDVIDRMGSPDEVAAAFMAQVTMNYAPNGRRLAAFAIDMVILVGTVIVCSFTSVALGNLVPQHPGSPSDTLMGALWILGVIAFALVAIGAMLLYFPLLEGRFGRTPGKRLLGLRVLKENGLPITFKDAILRRLPFYFEFWPVDGLFIFFTQKHQRGFDIVAKTIVVEE